MSVRINDRAIPPNTLQSIAISKSGTARIAGEAVDGSDRKTVADILTSVQDNDVVEAEIQDGRGARALGLGTIDSIEFEEQPFGNQTCTKYSFVWRHEP
jgi:hypothetical protein